ncbi:hypothetical protein X727_32145 [Mesorhizobium sp. L103C119B0]|nr:hypothetical protein X768_33110 [Mesorhizobium sp. LSJC265A00]ESY10595.1 hypothetical protein X750_32270 [Mesorhizobium sp. LNJC394B00]ESY28278.1 hypothetical protein X747_32555 [Mesorhizobium sp. LNJC384A00]ESZ58074.1 hypothetical protein X727_32145 [Mesorhizobium sp. L103C119B0]
MVSESFKALEMSQSQVPAPPPGWLPDAWLRNARLVSGLVLMAFVTLHFLNHALLLISLEAADKGRAVFLLIWRNPAGTLLLYGAVATHLVLSLLALYTAARWPFRCESGHRYCSASPSRF